MQAEFENAVILNLPPVGRRSEYLILSGFPTYLPLVGQKLI